MKIFTRIKCAIWAGYLAFNRPEIVTENVFYTVGKILDFCRQVVDEQRPMMTRFGLINVQTNERFEIVSLWACPSSSSDPTVRIAELITEIESLKAIIANQPTNVTK